MSIQPNIEPMLYDIYEVALALRLGASTVRKMVSAGEIPREGGNERPPSTSGTSGTRHHIAASFTGVGMPPPDADGSLRFW